MLIHPEIKTLMQALQALPAKEAVVENETSWTGETVSGKYVALHYGFEMLARYQKDLRGRVMDVDQSKLRVHAVKPATIQVTKDDIKAFCLYLIDVATDVFEPTGKTIAYAELVETMVQLYEGTITVEKFIKLNPEVQLRKNDFGGYFITKVFDQMKAIQESGLWPSFDHVFYARGTRSWALFINLNGAKYSLFL